MKSKKKVVKPVADWNKGLLLLADIVAIAGALAFAYLTTQSARKLSMQALTWMLGNVVCTITVFAVFGLYHIVLKNVGIAEMVRILFASAVICGVNVALPFLMGREFVGLGTGDRKSVV